MRKGQTALEYLITYGWAILVILVVTAVLWYYGIFNPSKWTGDQVAGFSSFTVAQGSYTVSTTSMSLILGNKVGDRLLITDINISGSDCRNDYSAVPTNVTVAPADGENILPGGQSGVFSITAGSTAPAAGWTCNSALRPGDMVTLNVKITFNDITTGLQDKTDSGTMMVKLG